jgi:hypothetical protein
MVSSIINHFLQKNSGFKGSTELKSESASPMAEEYRITNKESATKTADKCRIMKFLFHPPSKFVIPCSKFCGSFFQSSNHKHS